MRTIVIQPFVKQMSHILTQPADHDMAQIWVDSGLRKHTHLGGPGEPSSATRRPRGRPWRPPECLEYTQRPSARVHTTRVSTTEKQSSCSLRDVRERSLTNAQQQTSRSHVCTRAPKADRELSRDVARRPRAAHRPPLEEAASAAGTVRARSHAVGRSQVLHARERPEGGGRVHTRVSTCCQRKPPILRHCCHVRRRRWGVFLTAPSVGAA